jgi:rubrerythrin
MIEEKTAADWYRRRGMDARLKGDTETADLYEHVAKEEDEHYREFKERVDILTKGEE